jgi:serine protease AprX
MKLLLPVLVIPFFCFSQSAADRQKIVATYNNNTINQLKAEAQQYSAEQQKLINQYRAEHSIREDEHHSLQRIYDGIPIFFSTSNDGSAKTIRANAMYPGGQLGLSVTGSGMTAGVWDGGKVRSTHQEFTNRVTLDDAASDLSPHATHVTGTILAAGVNTARRGMAYGGFGPDP